MTVTTEQILEATGLKAAKTLTRWQKLGIIPAPAIGTHPSGRGKAGFYPDWVLDRCRRIAELQRQGHTLRSAVAALETDRVQKLMQEVVDRPSTAELLKGQTVELGNGLRVNLLSAVHAAIIRDLGPVLDGAHLRRVLPRLMAAKETGGWALELVRAGYNPVLISDGTAVEVLADFLVGHRLSEQGTSAAPLLVFPLLPTLRRIFPQLLAGFGPEKLAKPAPAIWAREGDATVEYPILLVDTELGFERIREGAKTVAADPPAPEEVDVADP